MTKMIDLLSRRVALAGLLCVSLAASSWAEVAPRAAGPISISVLGRNAFHRPPLETGADLQAMFAGDAEGVRQALSLAGWGGNPADLVQAVAKGEFTETTIPVGGKLKWMAMRKKKQIAILSDVIWQGKAPVETFSLTVVSNGARHDFTVPKKCGNLALLGSTPLPPPIVQLRVTPDSDCVTKKITVDTTGSTIPEGRIQSITCTSSGPGGSLDMGAPDNQGAYRWTKSYREPGTYTYSCIAVSDQGIKSAAVTASLSIKPCPPSCQISLDADALYNNEEFTVSVTGSKATVGNLEKVMVEILDENGAKVGDLDLRSPWTVATKLATKGDYTFKATAIDDIGQSSTNECQAAITIWPRLGIFVEGMAGLERRWREGIPRDRNAPVLGVKAGPYYRFHPKGEVGFSMGYELNLRDTEFSGPYADVELNYLGGRGMLGAGVGFWDFANDEGTATGSLLVHAGLNLTPNKPRSPIYFMVEGRTFMDHIDMVDNNYLVWMGLRTYR